MPTHSFEYSIIRVVPRVEREEFLNAGVLLWCPLQDFLQVRIELDRNRLLAFAPAADLELIEDHLHSISLICAGGAAAGPIGKLSQSERFHWLVAPRSSIIQCSAVHSGLCSKPEKALEDIFVKTVHC
jgi:hypothetical protein